MADVTISYKNNEIATMNATGVKTLLTGDTFCEDDIVVAYTKPATPAPTLQAKTNISPTTSSQTITADNGYDGLSSVQINAMPSGSATTPATTITANPSISVSSSGLITASASATKSVTPTVSAGYVSSGTAGTITVSGSNTEQLTTQSYQVWVPSYGGYYHETTKIIDRDTFLTGNQYIGKVFCSNLLPENIKEGVTITVMAGNGTINPITLASVTGTYAGGGYNVTVSLTNPSGISHFGSVNIYMAKSNNIYDAGALLDTITSPTGSATVIVSTDAYGIIVSFNGSWVGYGAHDATKTCTGGVALATNDYDLVFSVTGDGTATIDGVDWEEDY